MNVLGPPQDVKALDCAMINKLGTDINSFDQADISNPNKLPLEAKPTDFWGRKLELKKSIFKNSNILVKEIVTKIKNAKENDDKEVKNHCSQAAHREDMQRNLPRQQRR